MTCARVSTATAETIRKYDPAAERRAESLGVAWEDYLDESSEVLYEDLEAGWFPRYVERNSKGVFRYRADGGMVLSNFNRALILHDNITIIRLHCFRAIELFYSTVVSDISNVNEVDRENLLHTIRRSRDEWERALQLNNFYDVDLNGIIDKQESGLQDPAAFINRDRRYF
jgi:hypothetical protein